MQARPAGFTLLEVLIATVVITIGVLALLSALTGSAALVGQGRRLSRAALLLSSRADLLRQEVEAAGPECRAPASGAAVHGAVTESWTARPLDGGVELLLWVGADTVVTRVACR